MSYDPVAYWTAAGADRENTEHENHFRRTEVFARQEEALMGVLSGLDFGFRSILEVGCGWGRITRLVAERWPDLPHLAIDLSAERIESARKRVPAVTFRQSTIQALQVERQFGLVLAVETLMHVPPAEIEATVEKLCSLSSRYVVSLDWAVPLGDTPIAPWNTLFDYRALYGERLVSVERIGLQEIYVARVKEETNG